MSAAQPAAAPIPFVDLAAQRRHLGPRLDEAITRVLDHGQFIHGPEVAELEARLAAACGARNALGCASGTDALLLAFMALGIGPGDAVAVPAFTFSATAEAVALAGAVPVFADVHPDTFDLDVRSAAAALDAAGAQGLRPRAVVAVDLFGQPAGYDAIEALCADRDLALVADAAQSFGAAYGERCVGAIGTIATTSFFPAKPLGCYGDGGAVFCASDELAAVVRSLRVHGQGRHKYDTVRIGINGRLDTIQAAVLLVKLGVFDDELAARRRVAERYAAGLAGVAGLPALRAGSTSTWAQYTVVVEERDAVAARLADAGVPTAVYYPVPLHRQPAYRGYPAAPGGLPVSEWLAERVLSLPMHPYLDEPTQDRIVGALRRAVPAAVPGGKEP